MKSFNTFLKEALILKYRHKSHKNPGGIDKVSKIFQDDKAASEFVVHARKKKNSSFVDVIGKEYK